MRFDDAIVVAAAHASGEVVPARARMAGTLRFHIIFGLPGDRTAVDRAIG